MTAVDAPGLPRRLKGVALAVAWVGLWGLGHLGEFAPHASIWYPPAALTFASLVVLGARAIPYLALASFGGTLWSIDLYHIDAGWPDLLGLAVGNAAAHIGSYAIGAFALRRFAADYRHQLPNVVIAFLLTATISSAIATIGVLATLHVFAMLMTDDLIRSALAFWIGDFVALVVLGPLFAAMLLRLVRHSEIWIEPHDYLRSERLRDVFGFKLALVSLVLLLSMWSVHRIQSYESAFLVFFVLIPQLWLTYTESPLATAISLAVISFLVILLLGPLQLDHFAFVYQLAIAIIATTAYFGLAIPWLEAANRRLRTRLTFDPLTGAATRGYLREKVESGSDQAGSAGGSSLAVIDLDHFKRINDMLGHSVGDQALIALVESLRQHMRGSDVVARFGGDEFIVLLVGCGHDNAIALMERALQSIRSISLAEGIHLTASIGVATRQAGEDFDAWFARADRALYEAKSAGRDCVR